MKIELKKKPKNVIIIEGFPGFGLVGTISTEFLIDHLGAKQIGSIWLEDLAPLLMVHDGKAIDPLGIFYDKKHNLVILHAMTNIKGLEWKLAESLDELCKQLKAKEVISIEGVGAITAASNGGAFYYSENKRWEKIGVELLKEGIVIGVTAALMVKLKCAPLSCVFAETSTGLPDSRAAAKIIEVLDKYLNLKVDYKPLLKKAAEFENKVKGLMEKSKEATNIKEKKELSYLG